MSYSKEAVVLDKRYLVEFEPDRFFPRISRMEKRKTSGVLSNVLAELTGEEPFAWIYLGIDEDEEAQVVLELGRKFSKSRKWVHALDWAHAHKWAKEHPQEMGDG